MLDLQSILERHEFARIGDAGSCTHDVTFFFKDIVGTNPAHRIDIITAHPDHHDWYFRIYDGDRKVCHDRHFRSAEDALEAALTIRTEEDATKLRLRRIERWEGDDAYSVDGLVSSDVIVAAVKPNEWWLQVTEDNGVRTQRNGPWSSAEEAFSAYRHQFHKAN